MLNPIRDTMKAYFPGSGGVGDTFDPFDHGLSRRLLSVVKAPAR